MQASQQGVPTLFELSQVRVQDRGVEGQAARVQLAYEDILGLQLLQQGLDVLLRPCQRLYASDSHSDLPTQQPVSPKPLVLPSCTYLVVLDDGTGWLCTGV